MWNNGHIPDDFDKLLALIRDKCTNTQVQNLLRIGKLESSEVRISGAKDELIFQNLHNAIREGAITSDAAYEMLCDAEESGQQHVFYFRAKEGRADYFNDAESIASSLFGGDWRTTMNFPRLHLNPVGWEWADFRIYPTSTSGKSAWVLKAYSGIFRRKLIDKKRQDDTLEIEYYERKLSREILLVRWHYDGLLELRVPREDSRKLLMQSLMGLWEAIKPCIREEDFEPFDLTTACTRMIDHYDEGTSIYTLSDAHFEDDQAGSARFSPPSVEDHLMSDETRQKAIKMYKQCRMLGVVWQLEEEDHGTATKLRSVIGRYGVNNLLITSRTTSKAIKHVTQQLRRYASQVSGVNPGIPKLGILGSEQPSALPHRSPEIPQTEPPGRSSRDLPSPGVAGPRGEVTA